MCGRFVDSEVISMLKTGLVFQPENNQHIRMNFIDVLTRRFLLRCISAQKLIQGCNVNDEPIIEKITEKNFEMYPALPESLQSCEYMKDKAKNDLLQEEAIVKLMSELDAKFPQRVSPATQDLDEAIQNL